MLEVVKVRYDTWSPRTGKNWAYEVPDNPTWVSIDFRVTNLTLAINFRTSQLVPKLTDVDDKMTRVSGAYDDKSLCSRRVAESVRAMPRGICDTGGAPGGMSARPPARTCPREPQD